MSDWLDWYRSRFDPPPRSEPKPRDLGLAHVTVTMVNGTTHERSFEGYVKTYHGGTLEGATCNRHASDLFDAWLEQTKGNMLEVWPGYFVPLCHIKDIKVKYLPKMVMVS
jgi:hypothetical protein